MSIDTRQIVRISKALGDENRFRIFRTILERGEISCKEITELFPLSQPTISHHLKILTESGLIAIRKEGQWSFFSINSQTVQQYLDSLSEFARI